MENIDINSCDYERELLGYPKGVVINNCYGGFGVSHKALKWMYDHGMTKLKCTGEECHFDNRRKKFYEWDPYPLEDGTFLSDCYMMRKNHMSEAEFRMHPILVKCVETLGKDASMSSAKLVVKMVAGPWYITEYDGSECIHEI